MTTQTVIQLTTDDIAVFSRFPLYSQVRIRVTGTGRGERVRIVEDDFARVRMQATLKLKVDKNL